MIQTNAIIIAATLNTIRYSISLSHCLTDDDETGVSALGAMSRRRTRDEDAPSDRNCSPRAPRCALITRQMQHPSTSVWLFRLRQLITECFSSNDSWCS